jgi:hypothetical protein
MTTNIFSLSYDSQIHFLLIDVTRRVPLVEQRLSNQVCPRFPVGFMSIWCKYMSLCFLFRVVISALTRCSVRLYPPFCRGFVFYFCYLYLFKRTAIYYIYIYIQYLILLYFSYFFLYKFYCNKNTISIVSFNLSEKYYSPVNSTNDYSPAGE